ncbi:MAG: hypothetical protein P8100_07685 [bacterium]
MKRKWIIAGSAIVSAYLILWTASRGDWHLKRNRYNKLPQGKLIQKKDSLYTDEIGISWFLQPHKMNVFHQPSDLPVATPPEPYPSLIPPATFDPYHPNLKFLSPDGRGGSYEAILMPDGNYLLQGSKQGTYNYANPTGFSGYLKHALLDVLPHLFASDYDEKLNRVYD